VTGTDLATLRRCSAQWMPFRARSQSVRGGLRTAQPAAVGEEVIAGGPFIESRNSHLAPQPSAKGRRPSALRSPDDYAASRQRLRRIERDSFILIQHAYSLGAGTNEITVNPHRLLCDLGFTEEEVAQLVRYLYWVGFLRDTPAGPHL